MWFTLFASLPACVATIQSADGTALRISSGAFRTYSERVFRLQNAVLADISLELDASIGTDSDPGDADIVDGLESVESRVLDACSELNSIAVRRRDGGGVRPIADARAARSFPDCETAALDARDYFDRYVVRSREN